MLECQMPQDILKYKAKVIGGFTAREAVFLFVGGVIGIISNLTFLMSTAWLIKVVVTAFLVLPIWAFGFIQLFDLPLEKALGQIIFDNFICPMKRTNSILYPEYNKFRNGMQDEDGKSKKKTKMAKSKVYKAIR